jgi:hypothetical protein
MTSAQLETRQEHAQNGVLIASRAEDGFRVHSTDNPSQRYLVNWNGERLICTCPDFAFHQADPGWRCKHIMAVEPFDDNLAELPEPAEDGVHASGPIAVATPTPLAPAGDPPNSALPRKRRASKDPSSPIYMLIKRSVSPDGRIDSVSVEFTMPIVDLTMGEIKDRALTTLQLQRDIVTSFLTLSGQPKSQTSHPQPQPKQTPQPAPAKLVRKVDEGPVFAKMIDIGKVNGKWGDRLCITLDVDGQRTRLFGSAKQLASHIDAAGYTVRPENIVVGQRLDVPCLVTTKPSDDGKYLNVEQVFAYNPQPANGGANGRRVN